MNKEELYKEFYDWDQEQEIHGILDEFFESNVCIPKGENRHPYADEFHKWFEGEKLQYIGGDGAYRDALDVSQHFPAGTEYRIKPSEPVYEYKYFVGVIYGIEAITEGYLTEDEAEGLPFGKIESTKRERK